MSTKQRVSFWTAPVLGLLLLTGGAAVVHAQYGPPPQQQPGYQGGGWDQAPQELQDVQRQGFHDGIEGARRDFENHRQPNVKNRDEYRHPRFGGQDRHAYREGFRRGYDVGVQHLMNGGGDRDRDHDHGGDRDGGDRPHY